MTLGKLSDAEPVLLEQRNKHGSEGRTYFVVTRSAEGVGEQLVPATGCLCQQHDLGGVSPGFETVATQKLG